MTASTLLFLPGAGGSAQFWQPVADLLPEEWPKVMLSWPGLGDEPHDPTVKGLDDLVDMVSACIAMSPTRVDLIGQSMGGLVAIRAALRHTYRIRRLVLTGTSGGLDVAGLGGTDWRDAYRASYPTAAPWITETHADHTTEIPRITTRTLLLWGDADPISPPAVGEKLLSLLPNARLEIIPGGDHAFPHDRPVETATAIARHLA
jgi:pimeloyl-ACP methyl ester carboxylesterase